MADDLQIINTSSADLDTVLWLFEQAMALQGKNGYRVWNDIDLKALQQDIDKGLQYKMVKGDEVLCIFSVQHRDPFIWRNRDKGDAIYLHRIVVHPAHKGQKQFQHVLDWATTFARQHHLKFVRMDTWAENRQLIDYYLSFGFLFIENYKTTDAAELPFQNRNLEVALLELKLDEK